MRMMSVVEGKRQTGTSGSGRVFLSALRLLDLHTSQAIERG